MPGQRVEKERRGTRQIHTSERGEGGDPSSLRVECGGGQRHAFKFCRAARVGALLAPAWHGQGMAGWKRVRQWPGCAGYAPAMAPARGIPGAVGNEASGLASGVGPKRHRAQGRPWGPPVTRPASPARPDPAHFVFCPPRPAGPVGTNSLNYSLQLGHSRRPHCRQSAAKGYYRATVAVTGWGEEWRERTLGLPCPRIKKSREKINLVHFVS